MNEVDPGFLRPCQIAPLEAAEETLIADICPGLGQQVLAEDRPDPVLWGPYVSMQTGWAQDSAIRHAGSSGAALSMILIHLLETDQIEGVVQTAASPDLVIGNTTVLSTDAGAITAASGSRYAPSAPLSDLHRHLAGGQRLAFVGKPCDVAALRALGAHDSRVVATFPFLLSFFCAGVPSHTGARAVLAALGTDLDHTASFRYRGNGWPGQATATLTSGESRGMSYHESWGRILSKHVQHRCKICADGTATAADIVCADAWESDEKGYPVFTESEGISLIVARTDLGDKIVKQTAAAGRIETTPFDVDTLASIQPGQRERRRALWARIAALRVTGRPVPAYKGFQIVAAARQNTLWRNLKNFLGMLRRVIQRRN
ncbi:Coenzyme F420 hydrogenase/dehydrogenase, beta subunit C-terminal domain [Profundibacter sp.]